MTAIAMVVAGALASPAAAQVAYWVSARDWSKNLGLSQTRLFTEPGPPPVTGVGLVDGIDLGELLANWTA